MKSFVLLLGDPVSLHQLLHRYNVQIRLQSTKASLSHFNCSPLRKNTMNLSVPLHRFIISIYKLFQNENKLGRKIKW